MGLSKANLGSGNAADGIYLVTELEDDRGVSPAVAKPADPFFVQVPQTDRDDLGSLIYDVVVQPKNIMESLLEPDKTVEEGKGSPLKQEIISLGKPMPLFQADSIKLQRKTWLLHQFMTKMAIKLRIFQSLQATKFTLTTIRFAIH